MSEARSQETRTYRGGSLEELLPQILAELGPDAVITRQREGVLGGIGGFFGKRCVEVEVEAPAPGAQPRRPAVDAYDMGDTIVGMPAAAPPAGAANGVRAAYASAGNGHAPAAGRAGARTDAGAAPGLPVAAGSPIIDSVFAQALPFADHLTAAAAASAGTAASATGTGTATLQQPGSWADDLDLARLDAEEFQPLDVVNGVDAFIPYEPASDPLAEEAREWAKHELKALKKGLAERRHAARDARPPSVDAEPMTLPNGSPPTLEAAPGRPTAFEAAPAPPFTRAGDPAPTPGLPARRASTEIVAVAATLAAAGLPEALVLAIHKDVAREVRPFANDLPALVQARSALAKRIRTKSGWRGKRRTIALVGGPEAGKTLTAAKLCHAFAVGGGLSVGALSLESPRAALEFGLLTDGIGVDFQIADLPSQVPLASGRLVARDLIVVDTPAVEAGDTESLERLESLLLALRPDETHFLVPATAAIEPSQALLDALAPRLGIDRILITRLDEAPSPGAQVALSISSRLPISYLATGGFAEYGLAPADPVSLASMVLP